MNNLAQNNDFEQLVNQWLEMEANGDHFPVDFDLAWQIAGYSTKGNAKRKLSDSGYFEQDNDFIISDKMVKRSQGGGRSVELINLTCDAFKEFCMLSKSETGKATRKYFIEAEKNWKLTQKHFPQVAQDVEMLKLDKMLELERLRIQNKELDNTMLTLHGKQVVLALRGFDDCVVEVEKPILEVIDNRTGDRREGISFTQLNEYLYRQTGVKYKNGTVLKKIIEKEAPEIIDLVQRPVNQEWILKENIDKAAEIIKRNPKQLLIGE